MNKTNLISYSDAWFDFSLLCVIFGLTTGIDSNDISSVILWVIGTFSIWVAAMVNLARKPDHWKEGLEDWEIMLIEQEYQE